MLNKTFKYFLYVLFIFCFASFALTNTRISFSRPGSLIRMPSSYSANTINQYSIGISNEIINTNTYNRAQSIYIHGISSSGMQYGIVYSTHAQTNNSDTSPPSEISFHFNHRFYETEKMHIMAGINDILFTSTSEHEVSLFVSLINKGVFLGSKKLYILESGMGFGSGKINNDSHNYNDETSHKARFFVGLNFQTPFLKDKGGVDLMLDFDGKGTHLGTKIPINKKLNINFALTNLQNISDLNQYSDPVTQSIFSDTPGIALGLNLLIPSKTDPQAKLNAIDIEFETDEEECIITQTKAMRNAPLSLDAQCKDQALNQFVKDINNHFTTLNDSIIVIEQANKVHKTQLLENNYQINMLQDSINMQYLKHRISESELNVAMKHLSKSLQYFYLEDYFLALNEAEEVIVRFPMLAIAYARKGTIYYQMGDFQNATLNWNLALKHDPEYEEVQNMLLNIKREIENNNN